MAENQIEVELGWNDKEFQAGLKQFYRATDEIGKEIEQAFNTKPLDNFGKAAKSQGDSIFNSLSKSVAVGSLISDGIKAALGSVVDFARGSIQAAEEQENAINALSAALKRTGEFSKQAVDEFTAFSAELQKASIYGDEVILSQLAVAKSFGASNEQAKRLVQAAVELSATFGDSLDANVEKLGKSLQGTAGKLGSYVGEIKGLTDNQLKAGAAIDIVNAKLGGAGLAQTQTYSGAVTALKNAVSDLQEELGGLVTGSDLVKGGITTLTGVFRSFTDAINQSRVIGEANEQGYVDTENKLNTLSERYAELTAEIEKQQAIINKQGPNKALVSTAEVQFASTLVKNLTAELNSLQQKITTSAQATRLAEEEAAKAGGTNKRVEEEQKTSQQILDQRRQLALDIQALNDQQSILDAELEVQKRVAIQGQNEADLIALNEFENAKLELQYQAEIERAQLITDEATRRLAIERINGQKVIAQKKLQTTQEINLEKFKEAEIARNRELALKSAENFLQAGIMLTKKDSNEQKALASTLAVMNTWQAASNALATKAPWPLPQAFAASAIALGFAQVAQINKAKFANGGIVGGSSFTGDRVSVGVNSGEMILNKSQQSELFKIANNGGGAATIEAIEALGNKIANMQTIIQINSREIARAVRDERAAGFSV